MNKMRISRDIAIVKKNNCEILYEMKNLLESGNSRHVLLQKIN